jgi:hypothetical protein
MLTFTVFITQIVFIWSRTWNIRATARGNMVESITSGVVIHISWLISTAIGVSSISKMIEHFDWAHIPIIIASTVGGIIGTYIGMKKRIV